MQNVQTTLHAMSQQTVLFIQWGVGVPVRTVRARLHGAAKRALDKMKFAFSMYRMMIVETHQLAPTQCCRFMKVMPHVVGMPSYTIAV